MEFKQYVHVRSTLTMQVKNGDGADAGQHQRNCRRVAEAARTGAD